MFWVYYQIQCLILFLSNRHSPPPIPVTTSEPMKLLELRVVERKYAKQAEMIRSALAELGCEEAPSGCPDLSAETVGVDSLDGSSPDHQVQFHPFCLYLKPYQKWV